MRALGGLATAADVFTWGRESCLACVVQCHCLQACREHMPCLLTVPDTSLCRRIRVLSMVGTAHCQGASYFLSSLEDLSLKQRIAFKVMGFVCSSWACMVSFIWYCCS